jgi:hypothetical protein
MLSNSVTEHCVRARQTRFEVAVGACDSYSRLEQTVRRAQIRFVVMVRTLVWYSISGSQTRRGPHTRLAVAVAALI